MEYDIQQKIGFQPNIPVQILRYLNECLIQQFSNFLILGRRGESVFWLADVSVNNWKETEVVKTISETQEYHLNEKETTFQATQQWSYKPHWGGDGGTGHDPNQNKPLPFK